MVHDSQPTTVVNLNREDCSVYVGRGSKWGNPFSHNSRSRAKIIVKTREEAIARFKEWIEQQSNLMTALHELKGQILGCWCKPKDCHGDILAALADKT